MPRNRNANLGEGNLGLHTNIEVFSTALDAFLIKILVRPPRSKHKIISVDPNLPNAHDEDDSPWNTQKP